MLGLILRSAVCGLVLTVAGCSGKGLVPVEGQVVYPDGTPVKGLDGGQVVFRSAGTGGASSNATGTIDAEGRFKLGSLTPGDGAARGTYQVLITPPDPTGDVPLPRAIDPKYEKFETSGLEVEVKAEPNTVTLKVEPFRKK